MSSTRKSRRAGFAYGAAALAALLGGSLLGAAPAQAAPAPPYGTVLPDNGVYKRQFPSTDSSVRGALPKGAQVGLRCKVRAQYISGNTVWYLLRSDSTWVSARYVANTGYVPYCKDVMSGRMKEKTGPRAPKG
ncbi:MULTISPECIES: hypothetical protein [Streptomyces]|uniref:SH3 domain-containing protein n=1 Tax=Streptomyces lycii TaxID=2654337 RepID=A0ABQ7FNK6_9ACTN|nr:MULTISPECIES: hypothetical protein [Streptomyces]KAF4410501.1 SH3 domain-containing protein [Streptomyces lycii]PGH49485.1 hypothetical protein CRI70_17390 [Streptomyces sp. Ru87]